VRRLAVIVSDLHIGTGHTKGRINIYDDFKEDERFAQLLSSFTTGRHADDEVHLVLNGDIFDLLKVPILGKFPDAIGERLAKVKLFKCLKGHPVVVRALVDFLSNGRNAITYQPGNHDMELFFPGAQRLLCRALTGEDTHPRVRFVDARPWFAMDGVEFHHGHQFEAIHAMDFERLFLPRPGREPILNLPWGSLFILHVVNDLVRERPYLDKVHPFWPLFVGGMLLDTRFTTRMVAACGVAFVRARLNPNWWQKRPFAKVSQFMKRDIGFFAGLDRHAHKVLVSRRGTQAVFMGHTHVPQVRTWSGKKLYVNTGTWMPMVDLGLGRLGQHIELHYGLAEWTGNALRASLHRWHGQRPESEEIIS